MLMMTNDATVDVLLDKGIFVIVHFTMLVALSSFPKLFCPSYSIANEFLSCKEVISIFAERMPIVTEILPDHPMFQS
jgi:hypothetical protein